jgi:putative transposase
VSVARFIADQRTKYRVPHTVTCLILGGCVSWFYKWIDRAESTDGLHTDTDRRPGSSIPQSRWRFHGGHGMHGLPWLIAELQQVEDAVDAAAVVPCDPCQPPLRG